MTDKLIEWLVSLPSVRAWLIAHGWKPPKVVQTSNTGGGGGPDPGPP